jgi:transcriptional regulator NrdR family protein
MTDSATVKMDPKQRGLVCRQCGASQFEVLYTRGIIGGRLMRRRRCRQCGRRCTTVERVLR